LVEKTASKTRFYMLWVIICVLCLQSLILCQFFSREPFSARLFDYLQFNDALQSFLAQMPDKPADKKCVFDRKINRKSGVKNMFFRISSSKIKITI